MIRTSTYAYQGVEILVFRNVLRTYYMSDLLLWRKSSWNIMRSKGWIQKVNTDVSVTTIKKHKGSFCSQNCIQKLFALLRCSNMQVVPQKKHFFCSLLPTIHNTERQILSFHFAVTLPFPSHAFLKVVLK